MERQGTLTIDTSELDVAIIGNTSGYTTAELVNKPFEMTESAIEPEVEEPELQPKISPEDTMFIEHARTGLTIAHAEEREILSRDKERTQAEAAEIRKVIEQHQIRLKRVTAQAASFVDKETELLNRAQEEQTRLEQLIEGLTAILEKKHDLAPIYSELRNDYQQLRSALIDTVSTFQLIDITKQNPAEFVDEGGIFGDQHIEQYDLIAQDMQNEIDKITNKLGQAQSNFDALTEAMQQKVMLTVSNTMGQLNMKKNGLINKQEYLLTLKSKCLEYMKELSRLHSFEKQIEDLTSEIRVLQTDEEQIRREINALTNNEVGLEPEIVSTEPPARNDSSPNRMIVLDGGAASESSFRTERPRQRNLHGTGMRLTTIGR